jgi:hypothetical protein
MTDNDRQNSTDEADERQSNQQRPDQREERVEQGGDAPQSPAPADDDIIIK